jgi:hypothetical protein
MEKIKAALTEVGLIRDDMLFQNGERLVLPSLLPNPPLTRQLRQATRRSWASRGFQGTQMVFGGRLIFVSALYRQCRTCCWAIRETTL